MSEPLDPSPAPKVWSQRFEGSLDPFIEQFNSSLSFDLRLLPYDVQGSLAHAQMLGRCGVIPVEEANQLVAGLQSIQQEIESGSFQPEPGAEDVHYAVEGALIQKIGDLGKKLHTGRSRNDQVGTDLRLYLRDQTDQVQGLIHDLQGSLLTLADQHIDTLMPGYTHLQRAQPVSLAHHLLAYVEMLQRDRQRLSDLYRRINVCPLGSGALAGTPLPIDRHLTAHLLGFESITLNSLDAVSDRDYVVEFHASASLVMVHLSRLSEELILWASQEFGFITLTDACATGSSLMPQKKNPDVPELIRGKTGRVFGHLQALLVTLKGLPLAYNKDLQEDKEGLFDSVETIKQCLQAMGILLTDGIHFQPQRMAATLDQDFSNATDVADYLVRKGIPFRTAHDLVGQIVRSCLQQGIRLRDLSLEQWQAFSTAFEGDIDQAIDPRQVVAARLSAGGTGFEVVSQALMAAKARHQGLSTI